MTKGARKAAVPAKRKTKAQMAKEVAEADAKLATMLGEHGPHPLEGEDV